MNTRMILVWVVIGVSLVSASFDYSGTLQNDYHYYIHNTEHSAQAIWQKVSLTGELEANDQIRGVVEVSIKNSNSISQDFTIAIDELYLDGMYDNSSFSLGQHKEVWGLFDAFSPLDAMNAKDLTDFFDHEDTQLGVPLLRYSLFNDVVNVSGLVTPVFIHNDYAESGARWGNREIVPTQIPNPVSSTPSYFDVEVMKKDNSSDRATQTAEAGVKAVLSLDNFDFSMTYYYGHDRFPVVDTVQELSVVNQKFSITQILQYRRLQIIDVGLTHVMGSLVYRAEGALFVPEKSDADLYSPNDIYGKSVVGVEYLSGNPFIGKRLLMQLQWMKEYNQGFSYKVSDINHLFTNAGLLRLEVSLTDYLSTITECVYNLTDNDFFVRIEVPYAIADGIKISAILELFDGESGSFLGNYYKNDRIKMASEWAF